MSEDIVIENIQVERRLHSRHKARTEVFVRSGTTRTRCKAENLSAAGVGIRTENLGLKVGTVVDLAFAINLGEVTKIHRRKATVKHVRNGMTGFQMGPYEGK